MLLPHVTRMSAADTIFAPATGPARAAIAVLRLSGPGSGPALRSLCGGRLPPPRRASLRRLRHGGEGLDHALVLWFPGPGSHTGEDCAELHLHGGSATLAAAGAALLAMGLRPAAAGEFTRRALLNGRMDLPAAEAVADLVAAETTGQRRQALSQLEGGLSRRVAGWCERLRLLLAGAEALVDFPDEDLPPEEEAAPRADLLALHAELDASLRAAPMARRLREGLRFVVSGPPNVGKSSLLNALLGRELAITDASPGTTRDVLEATVELAGVPVTLVDTAGLRDGADPVEAEGVRRARLQRDGADLVLDVLPAPGEAPPPPGALGIASMADLDPAADPAPGTEAPARLRVSARTGEGLPALREALERAALRLAGPGPDAALTTARHHAAVAEAHAHLAAALDATASELRAEALRLALRALGRIGGEVDVEAVLDAVFSRFCIGK